MNPKKQSIILHIQFNHHALLVTLKINKDSFPTELKSFNNLNIFVT